MRSHLDGNEPQQLDAYGNIVEVSKEQHFIQGANGTLVSEAEIARRKAGGARGNIVGVNHPGGRHANAVGLPSDAESWRGSDMHVQGNEIPSAPGSARHVSLAELDAIDRASGTYPGAAGGPPPQAQRPAVRQPAQPPVAPQQGALQPGALQPGAYQLSDGNIMLVNGQGNRTVVTPDQLRALQAQRQARQAQQLSPADAVMSLLRGG